MRSLFHDTQRTSHPRSRHPRQLPQHCTVVGGGSSSTGGGVRPGHDCVRSRLLNLPTRSRPVDFAIIPYQMTAALTTTAAAAAAALDD
jgi:hypothetical protein